VSFRRKAFYFIREDLIFCGQLWENNDREAHNNPAKGRDALKAL